jgi:hypothetical protein
MSKVTVCDMPMKRSEAMRLAISAAKGHDVDGLLQRGGGWKGAENALATAAAAMSEASSRRELSGR